MSDNTTSVIDSGSDNSCVASGNSNSSNVNSCKKDKILQLTMLPVAMVII